MTMTALTDGELAAAARLGDKDAYAVLYRRYLPPVYDFLVRMTRDQALAEDLAQDTFVRAMQRLDQLDDPGRFRSWLYTIARNQALNRMEREKRSTPSDPTPSEESPSPLLSILDPDRFSDPEEAARAAEVAELVWEAASALDQRTYTVLDLTLRHGLESAEIAEVMGVSKGNASVMVNRMKERAGSAIGTYLLIRRSDCRDLAQLVDLASIPPVDEVLRRSVDRHVEGCESCQRRKRRVASPTRIMAAYAAIPPPPLIDDRTWDEIESRWDGEGPGSGSGGPGLLARLGLLIGTFILISGLGIAGAVQLGDAMLEGIAVADSTTTTLPTADTTTPTTSSATSTSPASTTLAPSTTSAPAPTTTAPTPTTTLAPTTTTTGPTSQPPVVTIILPEDGSHHTSSTAFMTIQAEATVTYHPDPDLVVTWTSSVDTGLSQSGNQVSLRLSAGCPAIEHVLTATATDSSGATGFDSVTITVGCPR